MDINWPQTVISVVGTALPLAIMLGTGIARMAQRLTLLEEHTRHLLAEVEKQNGRVRHLELHCARQHGYIPKRTVQEDE